MSHEHFRLQLSDIPHSISHLVPNLKWLELRPFSLRPQLIRTLLSLSANSHTPLDYPNSLSVGHTNMSLCTLGREMSVVPSRR